MATDTMKAEFSADNSDHEVSHYLYQIYRYTKAAWDVELYAPERINEDVPDDINSSLSDAHSAAIDRYMLAPAGSLRQLARKLAVFRDEELKDWYRAGEFAAALAADADRLDRILEGRS